MTSKAIPAIHAVGVTALFIGPFFSAIDETAGRRTAGFLEYRDWLALWGDEWFIYIALAGVFAAVLVAVLGKGSMRVPAIVLGSLTGLTLPIMFFIRYGNGMPVDGYVETWGWGLSAYTGACVGAAILAVVFSYLERSGAENR